MSQRHLSRRGALALMVAVLGGVGAGLATVSSTTPAVADPLPTLLMDPVEDLESAEPGHEINASTGLS